jgi:hypothetical protein
VDHGETFLAVARNSSVVVVVVVVVFISGSSSSSIRRNMIFTYISTRTLIILRSFEIWKGVIKINFSKIPKFKDLKSSGKRGHI